MKNIYFILISLVFVFSCAKPKAQPDQLHTLASWMTGSFTSREQSLQDTSYLDIRLQMIRIWHDREDAVWLYVEQAAAESLERPYRQRVYRLTQADSALFESKVYELNNPLRFAGAWKQEDSFAVLTPDSLIERQGCSIFLTRADEETFQGSTVDKNCLSTLRGASYAVSEVVIRENYMVTWDLGFDENDNHVWGNDKGGYVFMKEML